MPEFHPYDGWEGDLYRLSDEIGRIPLGYRDVPITLLAREQAHRLLAAFEPPRCGKRLSCILGSGHHVTCDLPRGHDGRCVPNVPPEAWRDA